MPTETPLDRRIEKIVFVMFENRGFDHLLGWLYDGDENPDVHNIGETTGPKFQGLTPQLCKSFAQPLHYKDGRFEVLPIVRGVQGNYFPCTTPIMDPNETFKPVARQLYGPTAVTPIPKGKPARMLGFLQDYYDKYDHWYDPDIYREILDTYDRHQVPILNTLAREYAVSDRWFCSIPSQTSINRAFSLCGNSIGWRSEADKSQGITTAMVNNWYYSDYKPAQFSGLSIWELLADHGFKGPDDWRLYYSAVWPPLTVPFYIEKGEYSYTYEMLPSLQRTLASKAEAPATMYQKIEGFWTDAAAGDLPRFTFLEPDYSLDFIADFGYTGDDYHPPASVRPGEAFLRRIYETLRSSPCWEETLLVITFDEHGGTFDHMPPPWGAVNPGHPDRYEDKFQFDRFGVRVPTAFVSPWVRSNTVIRSSAGKPPFDHTSFLATLIDWFAKKGGSGTLHPSQLGARVGAADTFAAVVGDTRRDDVELPPVWDCQSAAEREDRPLSVSRARMVAKILARRRGVTEAEVLAEILSEVTTEAELAAEYGGLVAGGGEEGGPV